MKTLTEFIRSYWIVITGVMLGTAGGYFYWREIGCLSGSCPITSNPFMSTLYGSMLGGLVGNIFKK